jgi:hypothetical protein
MKGISKSLNYIIVLIIFIVLATVESCSVSISDEKQFEKFYQEAESKFISCVKFSIENNKSFSLKNKQHEEDFINQEFYKNGINSDVKIINSSICLFDEKICGYSRYKGHGEKPLFDTTIYQVIHQKDTSIILGKDTVKYNVDIRKSIVNFEIKNNHFEVKLKAVIPKSIDMMKVRF